MHILYSFSKNLQLRCIASETFPETSTFFLYNNDKLMMADNTLFFFLFLGEYDVREIRVSDKSCRICVTNK